jgi:DprA winged helix domain
MRPEGIMVVARERSDSVSGEDARPGVGIGDERSAVQPATQDSPPTLTAEEKSVLETLMACGTARTVAQLCASSGLDRKQVASTLADLRTKGLVTRFNTLVESYAARSPRVDV